jgi:hypothetical protein
MMGCYIDAGEFGRISQEVATTKPEIILHIFLE